MAYDFPASPILNQTFNNYVWDGEKWKLQSPPVTGAVRYDVAQSLNSTQRSQARANIDVTKENYIINGAMMVSQENGTTAVTTAGGYPVDQFTFGNSTSGTISLAQIASPTPGNSPNRIRGTVTVADTSIAAGDYAYLFNRIEGLRAADLRFGSSIAKTVTIQFGCKAPAGTYSVAIQNGSGSIRSYVAEYVIAAGEANTDVLRSVTIPGDVTGTWAADNTTCLDIRWGLVAGTTFQQAAGAWGTTNVTGSPNQFNFMGTINNVFELFDVSLTEGSVAPPFMVPDYASELAACKRYWAKLVNFVVTTNAPSVSTIWPVQMRTAPTVSGGGAGFGTGGLNDINGQMFQTTLAFQTITLNARL